MSAQYPKSPTVGVGRILSAALLLLGTASCRPPLSPVIQDTGQGQFVFMWLAAYKDAYVSCGPPIAGSCPEENLNFGRHGQLVVARNAVAHKKAYVQFGLPNLPPGTTVEEAFFELYHPGKNEDGKTDDVNIPFGRAAAAWNVSTLTYKNEPNKGTEGTGHSIRLRSMSWSGSGTITDIVRGWYSDPSSNHGFYIQFPLLSPGIEKGFYSNNDVRRKVNDLGLSPRLLVKLRLPAGTTASAITLPSMPADNDLPFDGQSVLMARFTTANDWPADWNAQRGQ